jgi:hypothetical protein
MPAPGTPVAYSNRFAMKSTGMQDAAAAIADNHTLISRLAMRIAGASDRKLRNALFDDLARALGGHFSALETAVIPALLKVKGCQLGSHVLVGSAALKQRLALLLAENRKTPAFEDALRDFCDEVRQQADREQQELVPVVRTALTADEQALVGTEVAACMKLRLGEHPALHVALPTFAPPFSRREEVEAAALVLATLAIPHLPSSPACEDGEVAPC